ncbi:MAG: sulfite exporter TauE/SafE family protein [Armatimonadetes bacterium]|nr:sulfite exporter TauE/SafE family protein [Armatimonadota bacterium]
MTFLTFSLIVFVIALLAGFLGSLTGLGGGIVVTPALTLFLGVDIRYAIGASLISVIATSSGAAAAYVRDGLSNIRVGMFLEVATTIGALLGAFLGGILPTTALSIIFGVILLQAAWQTSRPKHEETGDSPPDPLCQKLELSGTYQTAAGPVTYDAHGVKQGFAVMFGAGTISGLLGIGSGSLKVIAMDHFMRLPFKVSTATSNFMIGVTAAASAGIYLSKGFVRPEIVMPVMAGVLAGSTVGAKILPHAPVKTLRTVFSVVVVIIAIQMIIKGSGGGI